MSTGRPAQAVIAIVIGVRPHFIKAGPLVERLQAWSKVVLVNTGQHYDIELGEAQAASAGLPAADVFLDVGSGSSAVQVGTGIIRLERELESIRPDLVVTIGDANSSVIGAIAAGQLGIPLCHVEAGVRKNGAWTIEEVNRRLIDSIAHLGLTPTRTKQASLGAEIPAGSPQCVRFMGDLLLDSVLHVTGAGSTNDLAQWSSSRARSCNLLATLHRRENINDPDLLAQIIEEVARLKMDVDLVLHPRTLRRLGELGLLNELEASLSVTVLPACGHDDMIKRMANAGGVITDSSGVQREAYFLGRPCCILRDGTEYDETMAQESAALVPPGSGLLKEAIGNLMGSSFHPDYAEFGDGRAAENASNEIQRFLMDTH